MKFMKKCLRVWERGCKIETNNYPNNYPNELTKIQVKILEIIKLNPTITVKQISELVNEIKYDAVRWNIAELKKKKVIERKGKTRKGTWTIL